MAEEMLKYSNKTVRKRRNDRNILTFYEKIAVIRYYDKTNISRNSLAKMFHCCATQIRRILEKKEGLLQQLATLSETDASIIIEEMTRKRRKFEMSAVGFILHKWVERCRQLGLRKSITNEVLKETALKMAAILNLPAFRPSYRWLNRFRGKYKYTDQDLGASDRAEPNNIAGELAVEDIIIEFKDSLPNFMQTEILAITSAGGKLIDKKENKSLFSNFSNIEEYDDISEENETVKNEITQIATKIPPTQLKHSIEMPDTEKFAQCSVTEEQSDLEQPLLEVRATNAGTCAVLNSIFPHLAVIHQFALLNSDEKALELISQLGVHMQKQAEDGIYKQLSLATRNENDAESEPENGLYPDMDDIILIE